MDLLSKDNRIPLLITGIIYAGSPPWLIWGYATPIGAILTLMLLYSVRNRLVNVSAYVWCAIILLLVPIFIILPLSRGWHLTGVFYTLCFLAASAIRWNEYLQALRYVSKILAWILIISLPLWLIHTFVVQLPPISIIDISSWKGARVIMANYGFFVTLYGESAHRFYSVFDEPGVLGTLGGFILYANKYNFRKWENLIILFGCFFAYSMAFIVMTIIGFCIISSRRIGNSILSLLFIVPAMLYLSSMLQDDVAFQRGVMYRLFERDTDELVDDRTNEIVNSSFDEMITSPDVLFGYGNDYVTTIRDGASYKLFFLEYGVMGFLALLVIYRLLMKGKHSLYAWGAYALLFASFMQRPDIWADKYIVLFGCVVAGVTAQISHKKKAKENNIKNGKIHRIQNI